MNSEEILRTTVQQTFSEMAFIDAESIDDHPELPTTSHIIEISYEVENAKTANDSRGSIALVLPLACKRTIVENIYGEEWERLDAERIDDCLLELVNVIAGSYLSSRYGAQVKRELSLPRLVFEMHDIEESPDAEKLYFDAEGTAFLVIHRAHTKLMS